MLSILLGHKVVKAAQFSLSGQKIILRQMGQLSFDSDIFEPDSVGMVVAQIKTFLKEHRMRPQKTIFCLSHHDIVSRDLVLPLLSRKEVQAIVVNEIERAPRFANNPYVYTYQIHQYPFDRNVKVTYYVFQRSLLEAAEKILRLSGCLPVAFDICPLSILNAFAGSKDEQAIVYMDDKASHLMACRGQECRASYLLNSGAEDIVFDPSVAQTGAISSFARDIKSLLNNFYDNEKAQQLPVFFAGRYPLEGGFFSQMSSLAGHDCDPFFFNEHSVVLPKGKTGTDIARDYAAVVGAIFRMRGKHHYFKIDNMWDIRQTRGFITGFWVKIIIAVAVCAFLAMSVLWPQMRQDQELKDSFFELSSHVKALETETQDLRQKREAFEYLKKDLFQQTQVLSQIRAKSWKDLFSAFNENIPEDIWLESVAQDRRDMLNIKGSALDLDSVASMIDKFKVDARFNDIKLISTNERKIEEESLFQFTLEFKFSTAP